MLFLGELDCFVQYLQKQIKKTQRDEKFKIRNTKKYKGQSQVLCIVLKYKVYIKTIENPDLATTCYLP